MSNANPTWMDQFIFGVRNVEIDGVALPPRPTANFVGGSMTGADNPVTKATDLTIVVPPNYAPFGPRGKIVVPPDVGTFTLRNPVSGGSGATSSAIIENHPSGHGIVIYGQSSSAHECFNGVTIARGTKTTLTVQIEAPYWDSQPDGVAVAPPFGGIVIYSPANNKSIIWGPYAGSAPSVGSGSNIGLFHQQITGVHTDEVATLLPGRSTFPIWLRWHDDGVNYNFSYSFDGEFANAPTISESRTVFLADAGTEIGVAGAAIQGAGTRAGVKAFAIWLGSWSPT